MARQELARFLRERRAALSAREVGLPDGVPRRTPGLRREEVAELAHMSVDYYVRLEQARGPRPSPRVLDALASALRLAPAERTPLFRLAGSAAPPATRPVRRVRPQVARMLERLPATAAIVTDATYGVVAWNRAARALLGDDLVRDTANLARRRFLGEGRTYETSGTPEFGHIAVARLRRAAERYPQDPQLAAMLEELHAESDEFRKIWQTHPVHAPGHRAKTLDHPELGRLRLNCDVLLVPEDDQEVVLITAEPGSPSAGALESLVTGQAPTRTSPLS
ncbi:helix-turn-helix transcriptional regulator [Streptomyces camelliae]|uniref:Helix-turn-helix transcriptional regulator n=1 Tax=Streptomyces camelliae TaxID=3004093 RepID=A0ABY7NWH0_9ACTN|nr:helix-turn-helix transcriptional regulator [Streptomyces sp. HUAS 2-6]WBO61892.1 helix-turn-helix transcriptional regulator [Streptomyces sp. HUAS 2-6]